MADKKTGFDLASVLADVSKLDTSAPDNREQIEYIDIDLIDGDPNNFYELSEIDNLAANIELIGLQQPLRVRTSAEDPSRVMIVSGHRRRAAIRKLVDDGREDLRKVACIREQAAVSGALQELRLIYANSDTRRMSSADISKQAERVEALLYQLKEEGYEFPGRMRDHVAEACKVSKTKLARLKMIRDNLSAVWKPAYADNRLCESAAYSLSQIPEADQLTIYHACCETGRDFRHVYEYLIEKSKKRFDLLDGLACKTQSLPKCANIGQKRIKAVLVDSYATFHCDKCCSKCPDLAKCKYACPQLADRVKSLRADAKEQRRQEKLAEEERLRPLIEQLQKLWARFGTARNQARKSVKDVCHAAQIYWGKMDDEKYKSMENGNAKIDPNANLPYGYGFHLDDAKHLIAMADLLGCSLDYLFCRTDNPAGVAAPVETAESSSTAEILPATWYPTSVEPPIGKKIIVVTHDGFAEDCLYYGSDTLSENAVSRWSEVALWALLPSASNAALAGANAPLVWIDENPAGPIDAVVKFSLAGVTLRKIAHWDGRLWKFPSGAVIEAERLMWYPIPDDKEKTHEE